MHGAADLAYYLLFALREQLLQSMGALLSHQSVLIDFISASCEATI